VQQLNRRKRVRRQLTAGLARYWYSIGRQIIARSKRDGSTEGGWDSGETAFVGKFNKPRLNVRGVQKLRHAPHVIDHCSGFHYAHLLIGFLVRLCLGIERASQGFASAVNIPEPTEIQTGLREIGRGETTQ